MVADTVQAWGSTLLLTSCVVTARALISLWSGRRGLSDWVVRTMQSRQSMQLWPSADQVLRTWQAVNVCGGVNKKWSLTVLLWLWGGGENVCLCVCFLQLIFLKFWFDVCFPIFDFFFIFMYVDDLPAYMSAYTMWIQCPRRPKRASDSPKTGVTARWELPCESWKLNPRSSARATISPALFVF